ncbi:glycosyl hydrolases family 28 protein [Elsinoe australis]|uniref:Glycosyl hydrolases family 28 protein n=1 Tax=Elsinoe australis TaxID=40998 RepID=A0A4U7B0H2_9PEZI|nr:glycosyl hydrolases family 28 protein [Elsinoe australis]
MLYSSLLLSFAISSVTGIAAGPTVQRNVCTVQSAGSNETDDAPAILKAFGQCGKDATIVFQPTTYYWGTNISYWLNHSLTVGYQNQSTAFILGGDNVTIDGYGQGTFNGNGDDWYRFIRQQPDTSNYPGRPHAITFNGLTDSVVRGVRFLRSQMWTMSIIHSHNNTFDSIFINNTGNTAQSSNTDGADTIFSSHIKFNNWTVYNGDDSISMKANSTDISVTNSRFYNGLGIALGSIGQYKDAFETIERLRIENVSYINTLHAVYVKTWTDDQVGYPPNGGGGGRGFASDVSAKNLQIEGMRGGVFTISQCTRFSGAPGVGNCTNSPFQVRNLEIRNTSGTTKNKNVASFQCSAVAPCTNIGLFDTEITFGNGTVAKDYLCGNVVNPTGFNCTGPPC